MTADLAAELRHLAIDAIGPLLTGMQYFKVGIAEASAGIGELIIRGVQHG